MGKLRLTFVVESGTDVRMVEELAERFELTVIGRQITNGVIVSQETNRQFELVIGPESRLQFARFVRHEIRDRRHTTDFILVQGYGVAALAANVTARRFRIACMMLVCSPVEEYYLQRRGRGFAGKPFRRRELTALKVIARINAKLGQRYCVLSEHLAATVRRHGARLPIHVVPLYGVDTVQFSPSVQGRRILREQAGLPTDSPIVFFSSRMAPEKDGEVVVRAIGILCDLGRNVVVLHRSGGYEDFMRIASSAGIADRVIATDAVRPGDSLARDYQAVDVCIQASRAEGLGFSVLEALACETPVIASATGGLLETVLDGVTGVTYPVGDAEALAKAIAHVLDHPVEARRMAVRGRQMVIDRFDAKKVFDAFESLVDQLVDSSQIES